MSSRMMRSRPSRQISPDTTLLRRAGLRDVRIRAKMALILVVPILAIVALAVDRLVESGGRAFDAQLITSLTGISADIAGATHELQTERIIGAELTADPKMDVKTFDNQTKSSDAAIDRYRADRRVLRRVPSTLTERLDGVDRQLDTLAALRQQVIAKQGVSVTELVLRYGVVIDELVSFHGQVSQIAGTTALADRLRAVAAFAQAKAAISLEQAIGYAALGSGTLDREQYNSFVATLTSQESAFAAFDLAASPAQRMLVHTIITGDAVQLADHVTDQFRLSVGSTPKLTGDDLAGALGAVVDLMRWTEQRLDEGLLVDAHNLQNSVIRQVVIESILVVLTLIVALIIASSLARHMVRALTRLRESALSLAGRDLPEVVGRLKDVQTTGENSPEQIAKRVEDPIDIDSWDEIGQVAQAFNVVHREAIRVAAEQAALRTTVLAMFLNLARRSQALVDRMIGELDTIERAEEDPKRLAQLFQLDHLATRMRRNDENLLVLAGADSSPPRREDAPLADVVRAAQSEVELYTRIEFGTIDPDVSVSARAVNDVVRLLAELFDNATRFSPPTASVLVEARRIGDHVLVQVEDHGLGMAEDQMEVINERLARPPSIEVTAFRMMGLAVVARLAERYGIRVDLQANPEGGTIGHVALPSGILILPRLRGREPVITRSRPPLAVERGPSTPAGGWPMPSLPGLTATGAPLMSAGVGTATLNGWPDLSDAPQEFMPNHQLAPVVSAVPAPAIAAAPSSHSLGSTGQPHQVPADETAELPIFREAEAVWFRSHGRPATGAWPVIADPGDVPGGTGGLREPGESHPPETSRATPPPQPSPPPYAPPASGPPPSVPPAQTAPPPSVPPAQTARPPAAGRPYVPSSPPERPAPTETVSHQPPTTASYQPPTTASYQPPTDESWQTAADDGWRAAAAASAPTTGGTTRSGLPKRVPAAQLVPGGIDGQPAGAKARRTPDEVRGLLSAYHRGVQRGRAGDGGGPAQRSSDEEKQ